MPVSLFRFLSHLSPQFCLVHVSRYALEFPIPLADLIAPSLGYRVPPDLATVPISLGIRSLCSRRPQRQIECLKRHCQLRDVKRITASCRNDVMISYKSSRPVGNTRTFQLFIGRLPTVLSAVFLQPCTLPEPFQRLSLFP